MRDEFDMFELEHEKERQARLEQIKANNIVRERQEAERHAEVMESLWVRTKSSNEQQLLAQYREAGVEPPLVNAEGIPTVSLTLLLSMGWTIGDYLGERKLLRPFESIAPGPRRSREDYEQST